MLTGPSLFCYLSPGGQKCCDVGQPWQELSHYATERVTHAWKRPGSLVLWGEKKVPTE